MGTGFETSASASSRQAGRRSGLWRAMDLLRARRAARRARWEADTEIAAFDGRPPLSLAWRVDELVGTKNRLDLAHTLRSLVADCGARYLPSASPVNRRAVRENGARFLAVAERLSVLERPVAARGVVLVDRLLVDGSGPLYDRQRSDELAPTLDFALGALESR